MGGDLWVPQQRRGMVLAPVGGDLWVPQQRRGMVSVRGDLLVPHKRRGLVQVGGGYQTTKLANRGIDLPDKWDSSKDKINLTPDILERYAQRVMQQRRFDKKPLAKALCLQCGRILWTTVDGAHTFLVEPPHGMYCVRVYYKRL